MSEEKFNPQDIEEILSRPPSSDSHKVKKGDIPEIAKSIGIGAIEIAKALPAIAFGAFSFHQNKGINPGATDSATGDMATTMKWTG